MTVQGQQDNKNVYSDEKLLGDNIVVNDGDDKENVKFIKSPEEKAFLKKLNWIVLPLVFLIVFIQFCDKSALSVAAVLGLLEDTGMSDSQFSWLGSIFYLGYLICQVPNNFLVQRLPIGKYLGAVLVIWGIVMGLTALCNTISQLLGMRFLLGLFEGVTYPCLYIILNTLYRRSEQSACWGYIGIGTGMGTVFGVLIAYGLAHLDGVLFRAWRWGYIVFGIATVVIGILTFFFMVDDPHHKLLRLSRKEQEIVEERTRDNCVVRNTTIKYEQIYEALREPRLYLLFLANLLNCLQNGGLVTFSTLLVQGLGFSAFTSIILQIPNGIAAAVFSIGSVFVAMRIKHNSITAIGAAIVSLLGCILIAAIPHTNKIVLLGFYLSWAMTGVSALLQTLVSNNVSGYTKRVFYNGFNMVGSTIGNFCGPLMMMTGAPVYAGAMIGFSVANFVIILCILATWYLMKRENAHRLADPLVTKTDVHLDLTDQQDRNIIYKL